MKESSVIKRLLLSLTLVCILYGLVPTPCVATGPNMEVVTYRIVNREYSGDGRALIWAEIRNAGPDIIKDLEVEIDLFAGALYVGHDGSVSEYIDHLAPGETTFVFAFSDRNLFLFVDRIVWHFDGQPTSEQPFRPSVRIESLLVSSDQERIMGELVNTGAVSLDQLGVIGVWYDNWGEILAINGWLTGASTHWITHPGERVVFRKTFGESGVVGSYKLIPVALQTNKWPLRLTVLNVVPYTRQIVDISVLGVRGAVRNDDTIVARDIAVQVVQKDAQGRVCGVDGDLLFGTLSPGDTADFDIYTWDDPSNYATLHMEAQSYGVVKDPPTPTLTPTITYTPSPSPTPTRTRTATPTAPPTPTLTVTPTASATRTKTATPFPSPEGGWPYHLGLPLIFR